MAVQENATYKADTVGKAFASQYYAVLEKSPGLVHRFYQAVSLMGRAEGCGPMVSTTTMDAVNAKIQSFGSLKADVKSVQAQESFNGGVIVLVIGAMVDMDESRRDFIQIFFLAPQDKGYYIFNDMFKYLDDNSCPGEQLNDVIAPTTHVPDQESHVSGQENGEVYNPSVNGEAAIDVDEEPVAEVVDEAPFESQVVVGHSVKYEEVPNDKAEEVANAKAEELPIAKTVELPIAKTEELPRATAEELPKKSYASIVMKDSPSPGPSPSRPKSVPLMQEQQVPVAPPASSLLPPPHSSADSVNDGHNQEPEGDGHSIYLRNLPPSVTREEVVAVFKKFGPIKRNGIQIRFSKGFCYGFLDFEEADAVQTSIEASPVKVCGRAVIVEEKRSTAPRGNSRLRYPPTGRGGGFRSEGGRGRGSYGGRGYSQGEDSKSDFGNRRSGGQGYYRGDGRLSRGSGTGISSARTQRVTAEV